MTIAEHATSDNALAPATSPNPNESADSEDQPLVNSPWALVDLDNKLTNTLLLLLGGIERVAKSDERGAEGLRAILDLACFLAEWGKSLALVPKCWVAEAPITPEGFATCACIPEYVLRLGWRTLHLAFTVAGDTLTEINALAVIQDEPDGLGPIDKVESRWPLVRRALQRIPLHEAEQLQVGLHIEYVRTRAAVAARLIEPPSNIGKPQPHLFAIHAEERMRALELLPVGWGYLETAEQRLAALSDPSADPKPLSSEQAQQQGGSSNPREPQAGDEQETATTSPGSDGLTVTAAAQAAGCDKGTISRAVDKGDLKSNGKQGRERRIDPACFARWLADRASRPEPEESDEAVERKLERAQNE